MKQAKILTHSELKSVLDAAPWNRNVKPQFPPTMHGEMFFKLVYDEVEQNCETSHHTAVNAR
jgi:hypothetical protein